MHNTNSLVEPNLRRLLIVSHVRHYRYDQKLLAYGPYAREIDIWADLFQEVFIAAPYREGPPPGEVTAFSRANIKIIPQPETGGTSFLAKLDQLLRLPMLISSLCKAMRGADTIHVRCPGNLALLGAVLAPLFSKYRIAKYAGQWNGYPGEPWTYRLQRAILRSKWWKGPVTVYGQWPNQPPHIIPFFTSVLSDEQMRQARSAAEKKLSREPLRILYVGRLTKSKNVHVLLSAIARLKSEGTALHCSIVGDGPERTALEAQTSALGLNSLVTFAGGMDLERVLGYYEQSDVLVLASDSEGWPKAIAEAMAFGLICVGSDRGLIPWMLSDERGLLVPPGDERALAHVLKQIAAAPERFQAMRNDAALWAQRYSLERLKTALIELLSKSWGITFDNYSRAPDGSTVRHDLP